MDPLSISASVLAIIQAAALTTSCLQKFIKAVRKADSRLSDLCKELTTLAGFLDATEKSVKQFQQSNPLLSPINDDIWRQSLIALEDCRASLSELEELITKVKNGSDKSRSSRLWRFTKITFAISLENNASDIDHIRNKIHKSNCALQTMLSVFNVSLSLRGNASQEMILSELSKLKAYIECSIRAAGVSQTATGLTNTPANEVDSQSQVARNLKSLAQAAKIFHTAASTTASSMCRSSIGAIMPAFTRERIHGFLHINPSPVASSRNTIISSGPDPDWKSLRQPTKIEEDTSLPVTRENAAWFHEADVESDLDLLFFNGLEDRATECVRIGNVSKAEMLLEQAITRHAEKRNAVDVDRLQVQLSVCYLFLGKWDQAEPLIQQLAQLQSTSTGVVSDLLHGLALVYANAAAYERATKLCRQSLNIKKRLLGSTDDSYYLTMGLLATIYDKADELTYGDIIRDSLPANFTYHHPHSIQTLIKDQLGLFQSVFGVDTTTWRTDELTDSNSAEEESMAQVDVVEATMIHETQDVPTDYPIARRQTFLARTLRRFTTPSSREHTSIRKWRHSEPAKQEYLSDHSRRENNNKRLIHSGLRFFWKRKTTPISKADIRVLRNNSFPQIAIVAPAPQRWQPPSPRSLSPRQSIVNIPISQDQTPQNDATHDADTHSLNSSRMSFSSLLAEFEDIESSLPLSVDLLVTKNDRPDSLTIPAEFFIIPQETTSEDLPKPPISVPPSMPPTKPLPSLPRRKASTPPRISAVLSTHQSQLEPNEQKTPPRISAVISTHQSQLEPNEQKTPPPPFDIETKSPISSTSRTPSELSETSRYADFHLRALRDSDFSIAFPTCSTPSNHSSLATSITTRTSGRSPCHSRTASSSSTASSKRAGVMIVSDSPFIPDLAEAESKDRDYFNNLYKNLMAQSQSQGDGGRGNGAKYLWSHLTVEPSRKDGFDPFF